MAEGGRGGGGGEGMGGREGGGGWKVEIEGWGGWIQIHGLAMCTIGCLEVTCPCELCELVYHVMQWMLCAPCGVRCDGHVVQLCD